MDYITTGGVVINQTGFRLLKLKVFWRIIIMYNLVYYS